MNGFTLYLLDATHSEQIENVTSFTGEDATGSFGLLANHSRFMTVLSLGIAKFRVADGAWKYLAVPGGVVYFQNNRMTLCSYRFLMDDDYHRIHEALEQQLLADEEKLQAFKASLHHMEEKVFMQLWEMGKREVI
jgi:F-type H+-transporting ATPase subunit epsilon